MRTGPILPHDLGRLVDLGFAPYGPSLPSSTQASTRRVGCESPFEVSPRKGAPTLASFCRMKLHAPEISLPLSARLAPHPDYQAGRVRNVWHRLQPSEFADYARCE